MAATCSRPDNSQAGDSTWHNFGAVNVTVWLACTVSPGGTPESLSRPEGRSTDTTSASGNRSLMARISSSARPFAAP